MVNFISVASVTSFCGSWIFDEFTEGLRCSSNRVEDSFGNGKEFFNCWRSGSIEQVGVVVATQWWWEVGRGGIISAEVPFLRLGGAFGYAAFH